MMYKIYSFLLILCLVFMSNESSAKPPIFVESYQDAKTITQDMQMPMIVIFSASWCKFCIKIKEDIVNNMNMFEDTVICIIDIEQHQDLAKKFRVKKIPKMIIFNDKGKEIDNIIGYTDIKKLKIK